MDGERKVSQVFNSNPQGSRLRVRLKNKWWSCVQTDISKCKITSWEERPKAELCGKSTIRRRRPALAYSAIKEEEDCPLQSLYIGTSASPTSRSISVTPVL